MCDDSSHSQPAVTRRNFLRAGGVLAGAMLFDSQWKLPARASSTAFTFDGTTARSMAMHVHSSFSEQSGSMEAQLFQAQSNAVDVLWWTDHDHRMEAIGYRSVVHFTSLTAETTDGPAWTWRQQTTGTLTAQSSGGIASIGSPNDPIPGSSLGVTAQSTSTGTASLGFNAATTNNHGYNERANLYGQTWLIDVLPASVGLDGYLEILLTTSYHPAQNGRAASTYSVSYRVGGAGVPGTTSTTGTAGVVTLPAVVGQWNTLSITPCDDIAALWPDMNPHDFSSFVITLSAVSNGGLASGNFDYLRFIRQYTSGDIPLQTQQEIAAGYASAFPSVTQRQGLEMSLFYPHVNWFGGAVTLPNYHGVTKQTYPAFMAQQVSNVHAAGGLSSYNHPYGADGGPLLPKATQDSKMSQLGAALLNNNALGTDIIEVGYLKRGGADLAHHVGLWDILSRNAVALTGNGVNDDHFGTNWYGGAASNNWDTSVWTPSTSEADLLQALLAGRAWTGSLHYRITLDLLTDGTCPMGSVSVSSLPQRQLQVFATGVPQGGNVQVLRGTVDYAGTADPVPNTQLVGSYTATAFATGSVSLAVDTTSSCFVRVAVTTSKGVVVALSNPVWLLRAAPPNGIPHARGA